MEEKKDPFAFLAVTQEETEKAVHVWTTVRESRDGRICVCGHPFNRHATNDRGESHCTPTRMVCPCKTSNKRAVLEVSDTRAFLRKSRGAGVDHALIQGLNTAYKNQSDVEWLIEPACDVCKQGSNELTFVMVHESGFEAEKEPTGYDAIMCPDCRSK